jgi:hypothetical protein
MQKQLRSYLWPPDCPQITKMNHRADSGKKNLPAVASEPRNNKTCWLLSHTASRDQDTNRNETPFTPAIPRFFGSNAGKTECNLAAQTLSRLFSVERAGNCRRRPHGEANKRSPEAGAQLMPATHMQGTPTRRRFALLP